MKGYVEKLERLGYVLPQDISVGLILNGLTKDFVGFVRNYNMHNMGKTIGEIHAMLIEYEKGLPKKAETPQVMMIKSGKIQKANKKSLNAKGKNKVKGKGKDKKDYIPKPKNPKPTAMERPAKDDACHHCKEVGHWKRNCPVYLAELQKKRKQVGSASSSGIFTIELFSFPNNNSWVYDTGCGTNICITKQGFRIERKLKQGALYLYVGNGVRAQVEAIGSFDLVLPNGLVICLDNCHYAPTITRGVVSVSRLVDNGFVQCFTDYGISVSKNGVLYFNAISRNGIYEIDMHDLVPKNVIPIYNVWECEALVKRDTLDKLQQRSFKCIFHNDTQRKCWNNITTSHLKTKLLLARVDYEETFSPVADIRAIRILIAIAAFYDYEIWKMDVKITFLNGYLDEDIYMVQPEGFVDPNHPRKVCKLQRSIYGLKQASRSWNKRFDEEIKRFGFAQNLDEPCVYQKASGSNVTFLILYVDDIIIMGNHIPSLQSVKDYLGKCFAMKDLGEAAFILGIKIYRDRSKRLIGLSQNAYMDKILKRYKMDNSKRGHIPMQERLDLNKSQGAQTPKEVNRMKNVPYASAVGSIMYAVRCTRPDVAFAQNLTSRFQQNPGELHWTAVKNILKYLRNTKDMFLVYGGNPSTELRVECYCDAGFETDRDDTKSQTGYVFVLNGGAVDWKSSKQSTTAMSATESEYIAASEAVMEAVWIRKFISGLGIVPTINEPLNMYYDNSAVVYYANEPGIQRGARHYHRRYHYVRECVVLGEIRILKVHTDNNLADPFTKVLSNRKLTQHARGMGLHHASSFM
ncbi:retrotransposon protein, putative, ty1-copia subclass [Tanacetum coccineum]|uniref:Retrotransposon protein, putative, ty1-copia subclass n=1 Tax=Tanacetum coccineum TaxID=301880 RepID=A0ABQ5BAM6_9ASTR